MIKAEVKQKLIDLEDLEWLIEWSYNYIFNIHLAADPLSYASWVNAFSSLILKSFRIITNLSDPLPPPCGDDDCYFQIFFHFESKSFLLLFKRKAWRGKCFGFYVWQIAFLIIGYPTVGQIDLLFRSGDSSLFTCFWPGVITLGYFEGNTLMGWTKLIHSNEHRLIRQGQVKVLWKRGGGSISR